MHTLQSPILVERVVEGDEYAVALTIDPRDVLPDLLMALGSCADLLVRAAEYRCRRTSPQRRKELVREIAAAPQVRDALTLLVAPGAAEELIEPIDEAVTEPERCLASDCDSYAIDKAQHCGPHADAVPTRLRAV